MSSRHFRRTRTGIAFGTALSACFFCAIAAHAERIEPPLELLRAAGNLLVAGTLLEINPPDRFVFARKEVLAGKAQPPAQIDVRAPASSLQGAKVGERYVFGYRIAQPDPRNPTRIIADPKGAVLITSTGLEPALFRDTPALRAILEASRSEHGRESRRLLDLLLGALAGSDRPLQNLAAGQITQDLETGQRLRDSDRSLIERVARDHATPPDVRAALLLAAETRPAAFGAWWQAGSLDVIASTPVGGYAPGTSDPTALVLLAFEVLGQHAVPIAPAVLKRWISSASPALVEHACLILRRQSPGEERSAIQHALADPALPGQTRRFLNDHLRRLDRMEHMTNARKAGAG